MVAGTAAGVDSASALPPRRYSAARWLLRITAMGRTTDITGHTGTADIGIMGRGGTTGTDGGDGIIGRGIIGTAGAMGVGIAGTTGNRPHRLRSHSSGSEPHRQVADRDRRGICFRIAGLRIRSPARLTRISN